MNIVFSTQAENFLKKCSVDLRKRIFKKLEFYASAPNPLEFAEHLTKDAEAPYRFRIGNWRIKFSIENSVIAVKQIGPRDKIYN